MEREARKKQHEKEKAERQLEGDVDVEEVMDAEEVVDVEEVMGVGVEAKEDLIWKNLRTLCSSSSDEGVGYGEVFVQQTSVTCPVCGLHESEDEEETQLVCCNQVSCSTWYHATV